MSDKLDGQELEAVAESDHAEAPEQEENLGPSSQIIRPTNFLQLDSNDLVTVQIDRVLFRISADILRLCSAITSPIPDHLTLSGLSAARLSCFLTVAKAKIIWSKFSLPFEDWISTLHAATQLGCKTIRTFAINSMNQEATALKPLPLVQLGLRYRVNKWTEQGFARLIERNKSLSYEEGTALGMRRVLAIYRGREALARKNSSCTTTDLINEEPDLKTPVYEELNEIQSHVPTDPPPASKHPIHYEANLVDIVAEDSVWRASMATLGATSYFKERMEQQQSSEGEECPIVDVSGEVTRADLKDYLVVVNARRFNTSPSPSSGLTGFQQWVGVLRSATIFGHSDARRFAINALEHHLMDQDPFDVVDAAKACNVGHWLQPQYVRIAERRNFPSEEEGRRLGVTSLLAVCQLRELSAYTMGKEAGVAAAATTAPNVTNTSKKAKIKSHSRPLSGGWPGTPSQDPYH